MGVKIEKTRAYQEASRVGRLEMILTAWAEQKQLCQASGIPEPVRPWLLGLVMAEYLQEPLSPVQVLFPLWRVEHGQWPKDPESRRKYLRIQAAAQTARELLNGDMPILSEEWLIESPLPKVELRRPSRERVTLQDAPFIESPFSTREVARYLQSKGLEGSLTEILDRLRGPEGPVLRRRCFSMSEPIKLSLSLAAHLRPQDPSVKFTWEWAKDRTGFDDVPLAMAIESLVEPGSLDAWRRNLGVSATFEVLRERLLPAASEKPKPSLFSGIKEVPSTGPTPTYRVFNLWLSLRRPPTDAECLQLGVRRSVLNQIRGTAKKAIDALHGIDSPNVIAARVWLHWTFAPNRKRLENQLSEAEAQVFRYWRRAGTATTIYIRDLGLGRASA